MKKIAKLQILAVLLIASACAYNYPPGFVTPLTRYVPFNEQDYKKYEGGGTSSIVGQAFLVTRGGTTKYGSGCKVECVPVTAYTTEYHDITVVRDRLVTANDYRLGGYTRSTIADGNGNFEFHNLPAGDYYIWCDIHWEYARGGYATGYAGAIAYAQTHVDAGKTVKVIASH